MPIGRRDANTRVEVNRPSYWLKSLIGLTVLKITYEMEYRLHPTVFQKLNFSGKHEYWTPAVLETKI